MCFIYENIRCIYFFQVGAFISLVLQSSKHREVKEAVQGHAAGRLHCQIQLGFEVHIHNCYDILESTEFSEKC